MESIKKPFFCFPWKAKKFRHGGKIPTVGIGKRREKIPLWWEISLSGRKKVFRCMDHLVLRHPSYMRGTTYPFSLSAGVRVIAQISLTVVAGAQRTMLSGCSVEYHPNWQRANDLATSHPTYTRHNRIEQHHPLLSYAIYFYTTQAN
jgi:hypothetical protein